MTGRNNARAFTLIELLTVVVVLGIAGAMVIPSMTSVHALRVQGAIRTLVSDLTFAQSDAIGFQRRRAVVFDVTKQQYRVVDVPGSTIDAANNTLFKPDGPQGRFVVDLTRPEFGGAVITSVNFNTDGLPATLIFDDMGSPSYGITGDTPGLGGTVRITGSGQVFDIVVEPYTGRVTVRRISGTP